MASKSRQQKATMQEKKFEQYQLEKSGFKYSVVDESYMFMPTRTKKQRQLKADAQLKEYKRLAKRADQRLVRLEAAAQTEKYKNVKKFAYRKAIMDIHKFFGETANRFNRSLKGLSSRQIDARIGSVVDFLNSMTSTTIGIEKSFNQRQDTFEENHPGISWEDALRVFERGLIVKHSRLLNSDLILKIMMKKEVSQKKLDDFLEKATKQDYTSKKDADDLLDYIGNALKEKRGGKSTLSEKELLEFLNS